MKELKSKLKKFYEEVGEKYPEKEIIYCTLRGILRKKFISQYLNKLNGSLLDIGCNAGMYLDEYQGGKRYGVDLSFNVLKKNNISAEKYLVVADAENLFCFRAGSFDHVLCSEVLEHCLNPLAVFQSIYHVLKKEGLAILTTPNYRKHRPGWVDLGSLPEFGVTIDCQDGYFHTAYQPDELREFALSVGLEVVTSGTMEKDVKYAAKIPAVIFIFGSYLNKIFRSKAISQLNRNLFNKLTLYIYYF